MVVGVTKLGTCNQELDKCKWIAWASLALLGLVCFGDLQPLHHETLTTLWFYSGKADPSMPYLALWSLSSGKYGVQPIIIKTLTISNSLSKLNKNIYLHFQNKKLC